MATAVNNKRSVDLTKGGILRNLLRFSLPLIATSILQLLFNAADMVVVGWSPKGDAAIGAIGCTNPLVNLILNLFIGMSGGAGIVLARAYGAKDREYAERALHTAMIVSVMAGVAVMIIGLTMSGVMLEWMGTPAENIEMAKTYLTIYFSGAIFNLVYNFGASMLRAMGDTIRPLKFLVVGGILNVVANIIAVKVFNMDVAGVAIATVLSQCVSAVLVVLALFKDGAYYVSLKLKCFKIDFTALKDTLRLGIPGGLNGMMFSLSNTIIQSTINSFGSVVVNGCAASATIEGFFFVAFQGFQLGALNIVSQNYGAGKFDRIKKCLKVSTLTVIVECGVIAGAMLLLKEPLFSLFTKTPEVAAAGYERFEIITSTYVLCALMGIVNEGIRGMNVSVPPTVVTLIGTCVFRILWVYTVVPLAPKVFTIYLGMVISWVITGLALLVMLIKVYKRKKAEFAKYEQKTGEQQTA